jgi:hypothetical protein
MFYRQLVNNNCVFQGFCCVNKNDIVVWREKLEWINDNHNVVVHFSGKTFKTPDMKSRKIVIL